MKPHIQLEISLGLTFPVHMQSSKTWSHRRIADHDWWILKAERWAVVKLETNEQKGIFDTSLGCCKCSKLVTTGLESLCFWQQSISAPQGVIPWANRPTESDSIPSQCSLVGKNHASQTQRTFSFSGLCSPEKSETERHVTFSFVIAGTALLIASDKR